MTDKEQQGIVILNRYTGQKEQEQVWGEQWLRWTYGTTLGKLTLFLLIKRAFFSRLLGWTKNRKGSKKTIAPFIRNYGINMEESLLPAEDFRNFNEFFYRRLKPGARPVDRQKNSVVFPADARHMGWQKASDIGNIFVKGQQFDLPALLGSDELAAIYADGAVVLSRLCPTDYHRFHFVCDGVPGVFLPIKGSYTSVSPYSLREKISRLWTNKRTLTIIETPDMGRVSMLEIGATGVGSIIQTYTPLAPVEKGDEKGYFAFGGSTVMTFFEPGRVTLSDDLLQATRQGLELYANQGDIMGH